jgi:hypothetical protein
MNDLILSENALPATPPDIIDMIREAEKLIRPHEHTLQVEMQHTLHAGMYARTARLAPMMLFTSVLIKIPTMLIVSGKCRVFAGDRWYTIEGYNVIPASAGRKQIYATLEPTELTMIFPTDAKTVEEAEAQFTDEASDLLSRRRGELCQA